MLTLSKKNCHITITNNLASYFMVNRGASWLLNMNIVWWSISLSNTFICLLHEKLWILQPWMHLERFLCSDKSFCLPCFFVHRRPQDELRTVAMLLSAAAPECSDSTSCGTHASQPATASLPPTDFPVLQRLQGFVCMLQCNSRWKFHLCLPQIVEKPVSIFQDGCLRWRRPTGKPLK